MNACACPQVATRWIERTIMTHTLNRRSRRPDGPQAADGAPRRQPFIPGLARGAGPVARRRCAPGAAQAQAVQARAAGYRIPAGPLAEALPRFADAAGVTVLFDAALLGARGTGGLNGSYSVSGASPACWPARAWPRASAAPAFTYWCREWRDEPGSRARRGRGQPPRARLAKQHRPQAPGRVAGAQLERLRQARRAGR